MQDDDDIFVKQCHLSDRSRHLILYLHLISCPVVGLSELPVHTAGGERSGGGHGGEEDEHQDSQ